MKTYSVEIKSSGNIKQYITTQAPNALIAIDNIITGLSVHFCNEYVAREVKYSSLPYPTLMYVYSSRSTKGYELHPGYYNTAIKRFKSSEIPEKQ